MIALVDYGMGNLRSVSKALEKAGAQVTVTSSPAQIRSAQAVVVPGVGAFDHAVQELRQRGLFDALKQSLKEQKPYLGLCLGYQLLFESSEEGQEKGLGVLKGTVKRFKISKKIPHMGWNRVEFNGNACPLWKGLPPSPYFYFVHSYYAAPEDQEYVAGQTDYGGKFASAIWRQSIYATQFHPEKSQENGLKVLENFLAAISERATSS